MDMLVFRVACLAVVMVAVLVRAGSADILGYTR